MRPRSTHLGADDGQNKRPDEDDAVPPVGDVLVSSHHLGVHVVFFRLDATNTSPNRCAVIEDGMHEDRGKGGKASPVDDVVGSAKVELRISFIG